MGVHEAYNEIFPTLKYVRVDYTLESFRGLKSLSTRNIN